MPSQSASVEKCTKFILYGPVTHLLPSRPNNSVHLRELLALNKIKTGSLIRLCQSIRISLALLNKSAFQNSSWLYGIILGLLLHSQHTMLYKYNESCRHKIKKSRYKVTNWQDYNKVLLQIFIKCKAALICRQNYPAKAMNCYRFFQTSDRCKRRLPEKVLMDKSGAIYAGLENIIINPFNKRKNIMLNSPPKFVLLAMAVAALFAMQSPAQADAKMNKSPIVIGHRGASGYRPEHTLEGYTLAIEMGADFIEPDLALTKDGHMIARHEPMIGATTDVARHPEFADRKTKRMVDGVEYHDWFATDFTLAEIKTLRAIQTRAGRDKKYDGLFQIPTLDEVITLVKRKSKETGRTVGIYPEIKHSTYHTTVKNAKNRLIFGEHYFENKLLNTLHRAYNNNACAHVFIQSSEVGNLQYLSRKTNIPLVQLVDAADVNADGSLSLVPPYKQPYDFFVRGDERTFADLVTKEGLDFIATYADAIGPWKPYLVKTVADKNDRDGDGEITINDRRVDGSTGVIKMAHDRGLLVHTWTFRNDDNGYGFANPKKEMTYYFDLGVDGLFTDFVETGVEARDKSINTGSVVYPCQYKHHKKKYKDHKV